MYEGEPHPICEGCGDRAQGSAHIVPQAVAKALGKTELCYSEENIFPACYVCNKKAELVSSPDILELKNFSRIWDVIEKYDPERFSKLRDTHKKYLCGECTGSGVQVGYVQCKQCKGKGFIK